MTRTQPERDEVADDPDDAVVEEAPPPAPDDHPHSLYREPARPRDVDAAALYADARYQRILLRVETEPGSALRVRLAPPKTNLRERLGHIAGTVVFALFALVLGGILCAVCFGAIVDGNAVPLPIAVLVVVLFGGIGIVLVAAAPYIVVDAIRNPIGRAGVPVVEIDREPVYLGGDLLIRVSLDGAVEMRSLRMDLVCREVSTSDRRRPFVVGEVRTSDAYVVQQKLADDEGAKLGRGEIWERTVAASLPERPHSFERGSLAIVWSVRVRAKFAREPDFDHHFVFRALPRAPE